MNKNILEIIQNSNFEMKTIEEISKKISSGGTPKTGIKEYYNGEIPWLRTQEVNFGEIWKTGVKITEAGVANSSAKWIPANCVIVAMYGATVGKIGINKIPMTTNQACCNIEVDETIADYRYVFHFLMMQYEYIKSLGTGSQTNINAQIVKNLEIPIPPLEIQQKVVEILDKMTDYVTELTAELTAELTLRQKQYAYYRDQLLTSPSQSDSDESLSVRWTTLGEIARLKNGSDWKNLETGNIPVYGSGGEMGVTVVKAAYDKPTVLIPRKGSISNLFYLTTPFWNVDTIYYTVIDEEKIVPKFFFYYLRMVNLEALSTNPTRPSLTQAILDKVKIPLPNLTEQKRIVESLDKFDKLTSDLSEGLPREIELRQKQYEYWREQLLSFKKE